MSLFSSSSTQARFGRPLRNLECARFGRAAKQCSHQGRTPGVIRRWVHGWQVVVLLAGQESVSAGLLEVDVEGSKRAAQERAGLLEGCVGGISRPAGLRVMWSSPRYREGFGDTTQERTSRSTRRRRVKGGTGAAAKKKGSRPGFCPLLHH